MGATTVWERWDAVLPDGTLNSTGMTSLNHYALGAVTDWLHTRVGGLRPLEPGYRVVEVAPRPGGGLTWATTTLDTAFGSLRVAWRDDDGERCVEVTVPEGVTARVVLPDHPDSLEADVEPGDHRWTYPVPAPAGLSLATPMAELRDHPAVWSALSDIFGTVMTGVPDLLDHVAAAAPDLGTALAHLPGFTPELEEQVLAALGLEPAGVTPAAG